MAVAQSGTPPTPTQVTTGTGPVTVLPAAWGTGQNRTAGHLLVALVTAFGTTSAGATSQSNAGTVGTWAKIQEFVATTCVSAVWAKAAAGGDGIPGFTSTISGTSSRTRLSCMLIELADGVNPGNTPVTDTYNTSGTGTSGTLTVTTSASLASAIGYAVAVECATSGASGSNTWGTSGSWTNSFTDAATAYSHWVNAVYASPPSGSALAYGPSHTITSTNESGVVVAFKPGVAVVRPGPAAATGAALDASGVGVTPGFLLSEEVLTSPPLAVTQAAAW